ncbi:unnamed protein product, partial [Prorocentrum cordatum]
EPVKPRTFDRSAMKSPAASGLSFSQLARGFKTLEEAHAAEEADKKREEAK